MKLGFLTACLPRRSLADLAAWAAEKRHGLALSSLAFYDNNLHPDPTERKAINAEKGATA